MNATGEYIYRSSDDTFFSIDPPKRHIRENYPWEESFIGNQVRITKEFFRCMGSSQNPPLKKEVSGQPAYTFDCGGMLQHSLPLMNGKEFTYPVLIDLLNYVQERTGKKVIITCGHRCPTHNTYSDRSRFNQTSKHMIAAEVDFYVKGLEWSPERVVEILLEYYANHPKWSEDPKYVNFQRYERETNVSMLPWYNKEVFIKVFKKDEGRDLENAHRFPYVSIQVKWDRDAEEAVTYSWSKAFNGYLRY